MEKEFVRQTHFFRRNIIQRRVDARSGQVKVALRDSVPELLSHAISSTTLLQYIYSFGHAHKEKNIETGNETLFLDTYSRGK